MDLRSVNADITTIQAGNIPDILSTSHGIMNRNIFYNFIFFDKKKI